MCPTLQVGLVWVLFDDSDLANKLPNWQVDANLDLPIAANFFLQTFKKTFKKKLFLLNPLLASMWKFGKNNEFGKFSLCH